MKISTTRITLSVFDQSDLALFIELSTSSQIMKHIYDPLSLPEATKVFYQRMQPWTIQSNEWLSLSITDNSNNEKIGNIGLKMINRNNNVAEIGFIIKESAQGKGYAKEAISLLTSYAFHSLGISTLIATCSVNNVGSYTVLEKAGFTREARLQHNAVINNIPVDDYRYVLPFPR